MASVCSPLPEPPALVVGLALQPMLKNLIAGVQLAITQPIRIDDALFVNDEWGNVEEITSSYVVIRLWDWRRMIVPLSYFIEQPFQNWTRESSALIGTVFLYVDFTVPSAELREKLEEIARASRLWDGRVVALQVTDFKESTMEIRMLVSASTAPRTFDLRCEVREKMIAFVQQRYPEALPRIRTDLHDERAKPRRKRWRISTAHDERAVPTLPAAKTWHTAHERHAFPCRSSSSARGEGCHAKLPKVAVAFVSVCHSPGRRPGRYCR
jgi:hypothetical protein